MQEIWTDIPGYEGLYMVSNLGRVMSLHCTSKSAKESGVPNRRILKNTLSSSGYYHVQLYKSNKKVKTILVHILVARAFIPNPDNLPEVNHKDGNKSNNKSSNLEWVTKSQNTVHAIENHLRPVNNSLGKRGKNSKTSKPVEQFDLDGSFIRLWDSREEAAISCGATRSEICRCINGGRKTCRGYIWRNPERTKNNG